MGLWRGQAHLYLNDPHMPVTIAVDIAFNQVTPPMGPISHRYHHHSHVMISAHTKPAAISP